MPLPTIDKAIYGDISKVQEFNLKKAPQRVAPAVRQQGGGRPTTPSTPFPEVQAPAAPPAAPTAAAPEIPAEELTAVRAYFSARRNYERWLAVANRPDAGDRAKAAASMAYLNYLDAIRMGREATPWFDQLIQAFAGRL